VGGPEDEGERDYVGGGVQRESRDEEFHDEKKDSEKLLMQDW
jgi:hypothetical protein